MCCVRLEDERRGVLGEIHIEGEGGREERVKEEGEGEGEGEGGGSHVCGEFACVWGGRGMEVRAEN